MYRSRNDNIPTATIERWSRSNPMRRLGVADAASLVPAVFPLGFALGAALSDLSVSPLLAWSTAPVLVAGASQLVLVSQLDGGASAVAAALAALAVNGRFVVYGAALAPRFTSQPAWFRWFGPHLIVDQTYGLVTNRFPNGEARPDEFRNYFTTSSALLWLAWAGSVAAGVYLGSGVPASVPLDFILPTMFVALVVTGLRSSSEIAVALGAVAIAFTLGGPTAPLIGAAVLGAGVGASTTRSDR
jgi:predicted branched-subunit amino acid permease